MRYELSEEQCEVLRKRALEVSTFESMNYLGRSNFSSLLNENYQIMKEEAEKVRGLKKDLGDKVE